MTLVIRVSTIDELVDSLEPLGSNSRHATSSTKLVAGDVAGIAFALGFALGVIPFAVLSLAFSMVEVRSTTASATGLARRLGVGFIRVEPSPDLSVNRLLVGGGYSGCIGLRFTRCVRQSLSPRHLPVVPVAVRHDAFSGCS